MRAAVLMVSPNRRNLQVKDRPRPRKSSTKILWCSWCLLYAFPCHVLQWSIAFCLAESLCLQFCMNMSLFDEQLPTEEITAETRHVAKPWQLLSNDSSNLNGRWPTWSTKYNKLRNFLSETWKSWNIAFHWRVMTGRSRRSVTGGEISYRKSLSSGPQDRCEFPSWASPPASRYRKGKNFWWFLLISI